MILSFSRKRKLNVKSLLLCLVKPDELPRSFLISFAKAFFELLWRKFEADLFGYLPLSSRNASFSFPLCLSTSRGKTVHLCMVMLFLYLDLPFLNRGPRLMQESEGWVWLQRSQNGLIYQLFEAGGMQRSFIRAVFQQLGTGGEGCSSKHESLNNMPEISSCLYQ